MRIALTGATGLLGSNLAILHCQRGDEVIATRRSSSRIDHLQQFPIQWRQAQLLDAASLAAAFEGAEIVYHCAAAISVLPNPEPWIRATNVEGTLRIIEACQQAGVQRLVHCSTVGAIGLSEDGRPCDETQRWNMPRFGLGDAYVTTKYEAQLLVERHAARGLDAVIVNPTYMIGPFDSRPSSGELIIDFLRGKIPGYTLGYNNFVHVRDVAAGMILAGEQGRAGEKYILGGHNMSYRDFLDRVADIAAVPRLRRRIPKLLGRLIGKAGDLQYRLTGQEPLLNTPTILWSQTPRFIFTSHKAQRALGYQISPIESAITEAIDWFQQHEMI